MRLCKQNNDAVQEISDVLAKHNCDTLSLELPAQITEKKHVENHVENVKSIEQEIAEILPGPEPKKDIIRHFESDFGKIEWNVDKKIITFDNGVVFTEEELLIFQKEHPSRKLTPEEWNIKTSFKGKFVEQEMELLDAKAS
jgi:hypothetical protein